MTLKGISELRKAGQLDAALYAAEKGFEHKPDIYTASALFWCLNDLLKKQTADQAMETYERMRAIFEEQCPNDKLMSRALGKCDKNLVPHAKEVKGYVEDAKSGCDVAEPFAKVSKYFDDNELDPSLHYYYGWLIFYMLKQTDANSIDMRKALLLRYFKLETDRPSLLHSKILSEALKIEKNAPMQFRLRDFVKMWGLQNFRDEDWEQFKTKEGHNMPSLVEKFIGAYVKEVKLDRFEPADEILELADKALERYPGSQNLPYFKASLLMAQGRNAEAIEYYKTLVMRYPGKSYLWRHLAELVEDGDVKIGMLCKAVGTGEDETFMSGARLALAKALMAKGLMQNAKTELDKYFATCRANGWNLRQEYSDIARHMPADTQGADNKPMYAQYSVLADGFIYSEIPSVNVVKTYEKEVDDPFHPGRKYCQWSLKSDSKYYTLRKPHRYGLKRGIPDGTAFEIKTLNDKIVWIRPIS